MFACSAPGVPLTVGSVLGHRYRLEAHLGVAALVAVYRAYDLVLDRHVAVKVLTSQPSSGEAQIRMLREAQAAARLNHPNIVSVFDIGEEAGTAYIVMELVESSMSLKACPPRSADEALAVARQVCSALEHAHACGIIHRDLKPANILLGLDGWVKLTDFSLAFFVGAQSDRRDGVPYSSPYQAPEVVFGQDADARSDLYSLGVMLYKWTVGEVPFGADEATARICHEPEVPLVPPRARNPDVPPALDRLIVRLLASEPDHRPGSASEVLRALWGLDRQAIERSRLDRELQMAHDVQASLLPHHAPRYAGWEFGNCWRPARQVAGDYYDFVPLDDGRLGLVIADVSDKGMPAALFMSLTRTIVRASISHAPSPVEAISHANQLLCADSSGGMFVTLFYGLLDPATGALTYVNAGHNPPLWYGAGQNQLRRLERTGMALGVLEDTAFEQFQVRLSPRDWLFLYTDGVIDATDSRGNRFGFERLQRVLLGHHAGSVEELTAALDSALGNFMGGAPPDDDVAWMLVEHLEV
jgi:serine/threonine protein kinase